MRIVVATILLLAIAAPAAAAQNYVVRSGDTLSAIAARYKVSVRAIVEASGLTDADDLQIGQRLIIPVPLTSPTIRSSATVRRTAAKTLPYRGTSWASSLIGLSRRFMGTPYRWGATGPGAFDCSGFMQYVYGKMGISLPRTSHAMYQVGRAVPPDQLKPGDMVFFTTYRPGPSHNGIYIGNGQFIHASSGFGSVTITPMSKEYYKKRYLGARRF